METAPPKNNGGAAARGLGSARTTRRGHGDDVRKGYGCPTVVEDSRHRRLLAARGDDDDAEPMLLFGAGMVVSRR